MEAKAFVSLLIQKLESLLREEATTSNPIFQKQVQTVLKNLQLLNQSLEGTDQDREASSVHSLNDPRVVQLLRAIYSAKDITDTLFIIKESLERSTGEKYGLKTTFQRPFMHIKSLRSQNLFTDDMKKLQKEIKALSSPVHLVLTTVAASYLNIEDVLIDSSNNDSCQDLHQDQQLWERISGFCLEEETNVAGFEEQIKDLVGKLVPEHSRSDYQFDQIITTAPYDQSTQVIVVVGERGSGKTTLARTVYCMDNVMRYFDERAWVDVSLKSSTRSVLIDILGQTTDQGSLGMETLLEDELLSEEELKWKLSKLLEETRYLIVLDDVETLQVWDVLREVLCSSTPYGSRIIITTCNEDAVQGADSSLQVCRLNDEDSWKLFSLMVDIPEHVRLNSAEFIQLKKQILKIGGGLPYQILLLTSLLSQTRSYGEGSSAIEHIYEELVNEPTTNSIPMSEKEIQTAISRFHFFLDSLEVAADHDASSGHSMEETSSNLNIDQDHPVDSTNDTTTSFQNEERQQRLERIFGLKEHTNELVARLIPQDNRDDNQSTQVIAVVGEGGSGKTTLVRSVYGSADVRRHFIKTAWVRIPSEFKARDVFMDTLKQINQDKFMEVTASEGELRSTITTLLRRTRYLIVVEDVETPQVWEALRDALYSSLQGGKIILTTRNKNNVPQEASNSTLVVQPLNKEDSWKLLFQKVRKEDVFNESERITLMDQIMEACDGFPSRISLLGGLLYYKEVKKEEWLMVVERVKNSGRHISALSYEELDPKLKPCFFYTGLFPRAFEIPVRILIHLWCAEGFVKSFDPNQEIEPEDLAEIYFEELVIRNMIQVTRWSLDGSPKTCRMPSFLYDVFSTEAEKAGFFYHQFRSANQPQFAVRRMAAYLGIIRDNPSPILDIGHLRSYVAFDTRVRGSPAREIAIFLNKIITSQGLGLLRILDLEGVYKPMLSDDIIGKLLLLSYLGLRSTFIDSLPNSVGKLPYLETLDVNHTKIEDLPDSIWEAKKLRHLYLNRIHSVITVDQSFSQALSNVRTLWGLCIKDGGGYFKNFRRLRKLGLTCRSEAAMEGVSQSLHQLTNLQSLKLMYVDRIGDTSYLNLQKTGLDNLQQLHLHGIRLYSSALEFLPGRLKILTFSQSELEYDPMPELGWLPQLKILRLFGKSYKGKQMTCLTGGFPELCVLKLWKLPLKELIVQEEAMPCLRELEIRNCEYLELLTGLENVTTLKELVLTNMPPNIRTTVEGRLSKDVYIKINDRLSAPLPE